MRKLFMAVAVLGCGWIAFGALSGAEPKYTIKQVMKAGHAKGALKDKVAGGTATDEEKVALIAYYEALAGSKPPKGTDESWKEKTSALLAAAKDAAEGKEGAGEKLKAAANCAKCHEDAQGLSPSARTLVTHRPTRYGTRHGGSWHFLLTEPGAAQVKS